MTFEVYLEGEGWDVFEEVTAVHFAGMMFKEVSIRGLTDTDKVIIKAILNATWDCAGCIHYRTDYGCGWASRLPCEAWEDK